MSLRVDATKIEGKYATPRCVPCGPTNPAPWMIAELRIEANGDVFIRGERSQWFRLSLCDVSKFCNAVT